MTTLISRYLSLPQSTCFLFGPRGTGKSTLIQSQLSHMLYIDLLQPEIERYYQSYPERLRNYVLEHPQYTIIVIDEIQKIPKLLDVVHSLITTHHELQFVLTGSSARKLRQTGVNLLGGRALNIVLHPFMAAELKSLFNLEHALEYGMLPLIFKSKDPRKTLQAYIHLYLKEEIQAEGLVRRLDNFSRFLEVCAFSHAAQLNISNIARDCEVKRKTVENYLAILEDLLLSFKIPIFSKRAKRALNHRPKFYLFDTGVFNILRPRGPMENNLEIAGIALEGLVAQHLKAWCDYSEENFQLYYWRTRTGIEVDFIIYGPNTFLAIEVKHTTNIDINDLKGLKTFLQDYPYATAVLIYRGNKRMKKNNIWCIPCDEFLITLIPNQLINDS